MTDEAAVRRVRPVLRPADLAAALRRATWRDALCLGGVAVSLLIGYATIPLAAILLRHVLTHLLVTGSITALLTAGADVHAGRMPFVVAISAGVVGNGGFDLFWFWAGRRYGEHVAHVLEEWFLIPPRTVARVEGWVRRWSGPLILAGPFLPIPIFMVLLLSGASGFRWRWFWVCDVVGWLLWDAVFVGLGYALHDQVDHVVAVVKHDQLLVTVGLVVLAVVYAAVRLRRRPPRRSA